MAPSAAAASTYEFESKGTTMREALADNFGAPITNVVTGIADISGDQVTIRVNEKFEETDAADQGTGNFGNFPLYLFSRAGTSLFYNGRFYGSVGRGALCNDQQLSALENYMEIKTFARSLQNVYSEPILTADLEEVTMPDGEEIFMVVSYV
jgi:hypothetical protein